MHSNDFLRFSFHTCRATIENNATILNDRDLGRLLQPNKNAGAFVQDTFTNLYFDDSDNEFLDRLWANIDSMNSPLKRSLALAAASRAAMKKRPRGIFTFTGRRGWDGRQDLKLSVQQQFERAVQCLNFSVFSNGRKNRATCGDVFDVDPNGHDLVYIDSPYISRHSDCDYTRRYHFVEGYCTYWRGAEILHSTKTKKIRSYKTSFANKAGALDAFTRLFYHFRNSKLAVSYSSNGIPSREEMYAILRVFKKNVTIFETKHRYSHGNQNHKIGANNNEVTEYLFIAV